MAIHTLAHSELDDLEELSISEIFHGFPDGVSYFVYAGGQVFDADLTPAGETSARLVVRDHQKNNHGAVVVSSETTFSEVEETAQFFADSWV